MNNSGSIIALVILITLVLDFILNLTAGLLNLNNMNDTIPDEFRDILDYGRYTRAQAYLKQTTRLGFIESFIDLSVLLIFWMAGGFPFLDSLVRSWDFGPVVSGLLYIGILAILKGVISLPLNIYSTFVIEQRFGFNTTTPLLFITDFLKSIVIACLLGGGASGSHTLVF